MEEDSRMRHFSSLVIAFVLASSGSVLAQQRLLIQHNDANDPCARFKMRILIPADVADHKLPLKEFTEGIDSKMVWNPCPKERLQLAFGPPPTTKDVKFPKLPFSFQRGQNRMSKQDNLFFSPPTSTFRFTWKQPKNQ